MQNMILNLTNRYIVWGLFCLAALGGCGAELEPIDRVQPNALKKSYLAGEWLLGRTVVGVPASDSFTFVGDGAWELQKVKFDIQEHFIYARRQTELLVGGDSAQRREQAGENYEGEVIAAFAVQHFDIALQYNPATGEESNVRAENAVDRPWHEREYMRVDWSKNLVTMADIGYERESAEPVSYFVQDPNHRDAPLFEDDYFDVTTKIFAKAGTEYIEYYGEEFPLCWFWDHQFAECGPGEYTIRLSFMKVDPNHQYEPQSYDGPVTELFGYFDTARTVYDRQEGLREQNKERYLNRHNIWETTYGADGSLLPYSQRLAKPLVYYVNRDWPSEEDDPVLNEAAKMVAAQWNEVFQGIVREVSAMLPAGGDMFVFCNHNPVKKGDPAECGAEGYSPRLGDIRHSFMAYVPDYMTYGLLGLGPSNIDPETGEIYSGMGYVYHHNDTAAWDVTQMVELLNGTLAADAFIDGEDLSSWVDEVNDWSSVDEAPGLETARHMVETMTERGAGAYWQGRHEPPTEHDEAMQRQYGFGKWLTSQLGEFERDGLIRKKDGVAAARLAELQDTPIEAMLMSDELYTGMGVGPNAAVNDEMRKRASVLRPEFHYNLDKAFEDYAARKTMYLGQMADDALMGLAREYKDTNLTSAEIYDAVRMRIYTAVLAHEVGHSVGLMHNFGGSDDAINYHEEYWHLRSESGPVGPRVGFSDGSGVPSDSITEEEINGNLYNYAYSSVMDYAGRYTIDGTGLGRYDKAAIYFGYGRKVQVFNTTGNLSRARDWLHEWADGDSEAMIWWNTGPELLHYTKFYEQMGSDLYDKNNRYWIDVGDLCSRETQEGCEGVAAYSGSPTAVRVPYVYCSHGRSDLGDSCLTRDFGADSYERLSGIIQNLDTWYITYNFPRGKMSSRYYWWNYVPRKLGRVYERLKNWHDVYGLYKEILPRYYDAEIVQNFYLDVPNGYGSQTAAVQMAYNQLVKTILMPDVADYASSTDFEGNSLYREEWGGSVSLGTEEARYYSTSWSYGYNGERDCGYYWHECLHHVGWYLDKIMAIEALTNADTFFVGRGSPEDLREWAVSYYSTFAPQLNELNRAIMSQDWDSMAPYMESDELTWPNYAGPLAARHTGDVVDPYAGFTIQLYWSLLGQLRFVDNWDPGFVDESRIWVLGSGDEPAIDVSELVTFRDPVSGITYGARRYDGVGAAEALLERANRMLARSTYCDNPDTAICPNPHDNWTREAVDVELAKTVELIKVMPSFGWMPYIGSPYNP